MMRRNGVMDMIAAGSKASSVMKTAICIGVLSVRPPAGPLPKIGTARSDDAGAALAFMVGRKKRKRMVAMRLIASTRGRKGRLNPILQTSQGGYSRQEQRQ